MNLVDMTVSGYLAELGGSSPAPGGGSASAMCGAQGAALTAMVAALTIGKKKYAADQALCEEVFAKSGALADKLRAQVDIDTEAFNLVSEAFKLPKDSDEQKSTRAAAIADATLTAAAVPFDTLILAVEALEETASLVGRSNSNAASDLGVAALNLLACARGAWLNVLINLGGIADEAKAARLRNDGQAAVLAAEAEARRIYEAVVTSLT